MFFGSDTAVNLKDKEESYAKLVRRYLLFIPVAIVVVMAIYFCFFIGSSAFINDRAVYELNAASERAAHNVEQHIEGRMMSVVSLSYFADEDYSYTLSRLGASRNYLDADMLGILGKDRIFYTTRKGNIDVRGIDCFSRALEGNLVNGKSFELDGNVYILYGAPIYSGNNVVGAVCLAELFPKLAEAAKPDDYYSIIFTDKHGKILGKTTETKKEAESLGDILTESNMALFLDETEKENNILLKDKIDGRDVRLYVYSLDLNDGVLISVISEDDYRELIGDYFTGTAALYILFFVILAGIILISVLYVHKAHKSLIRQLERFSTASNTLRIAFLIHSPDSPGEISYKSSSLGRMLGYTDNELEFIFKNSLEMLICSEDRSRTMAAFEEFYASGEDSRVIYFRLVDKNKRLLQFSDIMTRDKKTGQIISIVQAVDKIAGIYRETEFMSKRMDLLTEVSSCYVFDLDIGKNRLFISENLKARLGYAVQAEDIYKQSVRDRLISPHSKRELEAMIKSYKRGDRNISGHITVLSSLGGYVRFEVTAEVLGSIIKDEARVIAVLKEV